jgi:hypothetical protein
MLDVSYTFDASLQAMLSVVLCTLVKILAVFYSFDASLQAMLSARL